MMFKSKRMRLSNYLKLTVCLVVLCISSCNTDVHKNLETSAIVAFVRIDFGMEFGRERRTVIELFGKHAVVMAISHGNIEFVEFDVTEKQFENIAATCSQIIDQYPKASKEQLQLDEPTFFVTIGKFFDSTYATEVAQSDLLNSPSADSFLDFIRECEGRIKSKTVADKLDTNGSN